MFWGTKPCFIELALNQPAWKAVAITDEIPDESWWWIYYIVDTLDTSFNLGECN